MGLTVEEKEKVEKIISQVKEEQNVSWYEARTWLHKFVCKGRCDWYEKSSQLAGFERSSLTQKQKSAVKKAIETFMKDMTNEKTRAIIHEYLCPGH